MPQITRSRAITRSPDGVRSPDDPISRSVDLAQYYLTLYSRWGPQNWWPAEAPLEVIVGAYLTQNTNWGNVEKAIANLRRAGVLSVKRLRELPLRRLEMLIRPSGYFRQKAKKLKTFVHFLNKNYGGSLSRMFAQPKTKLRDELLALNGVGPETADSILLYGGNHAVFVVDAYTRRVLERHRFIAAKAKYEDMRMLLEAAVTTAPPGQLSLDRHGDEPRHPVSRMSRAARSELAQHYNEFHALIVRVGNQYCRSTPKCEECPLREFLPAS